LGALCRRLAVLRQRLLEFLFDAQSMAGRVPSIPAAHIDNFSDPPMSLKERGLLVSCRGRTLRLGPFIVLQVEQGWLGLLGRLALLAAQFENIAP
jgi:hypothetical protein